MSTARVDLLGLAFDALSVKEAARWIGQRPETAPFAYVVTPNADHLVRLHRRVELWPVYRGAALCLLDSRVVARAARLFALPCPPVAPGSDVTAELFDAYLRPGELLTIIGMTEPGANALAARWGFAPPAHHAPPFGFTQDAAALAAAVDFVLAHPSRLVLIAVGSPQQEILAAAIAATGRAVGTGLCVGASLEFLAGTTPRAPGWIRRAGMEWLFRLLREPRRLARRYLIDSPAIFALLWRASARAGESWQHLPPKTGGP